MLMPELSGKMPASHPYSTGKLRALQFHISISTDAGIFPENSESADNGITFFYGDDFLLQNKIFY